MRGGGGVTPVGLRPPFVTPPPPSLILIDAESHLDCRRAGKLSLQHLFRESRAAILNPRHELLVLASRIDWDGLEEPCAGM